MLSKVNSIASRLEVLWVVSAICVKCVVLAKVPGRTGDDQMNSHLAQLDFIYSISSFTL